MAHKTFSTALTVMALGLSMNAFAFTPDLTEVDGRSVPVVKWDTTLEKFQYDQDKFIGQRFTAQCPKAPKKASTAEVDKAVIHPSDYSICMAGLRSGQIDKKRRTGDCPAQSRKRRSRRQCYR